MNAQTQQTSRTNEIAIEFYRQLKATFKTLKIQSNRKHQHAVFFVNPHVF